MNIKHFMVIMLVCAGLCPPAQATHIVGGEVTYTCLGDDPSNPNRKIYRIRLDIYQDCHTGDPNAIAQDNPAYIGIFDGNGVSAFHPRKFDSVEFSSKVAVPPNFSNACVNNAPPTCLTKVSFTKNYSLPVNATGYTVVYQRCCRNQSVQNIVNPGGVGGSYFCKIPPPESTSCNTSAVFKNYPPQIICINNPLVYDHSATDANGDSLSYELCQAYTGGKPDDAKPLPAPPPFQPVVYQAGFSYWKPMLGNPVIQIDPVTGVISGTPNFEGRFVVTVCCNEWRNGVIINTIRREFQFVVTNCSKAVVANIPQYSDEFNTYVVECKSNTVKFDNISTGGFSYKWDFGVPGIDSDTSSEFSPTYTYPDTGTYVVKLVVNKGTTCPDSISRFVKVYPSFIGDFSYSGLHCPNTPIQFGDSSKATHYPANSWTWTFGDGSSSDQQHPMHTYPQGGEYNVMFVTRNPIGCIDTVREVLNIERFHPFAGNDTIIVKGEHINFNATGGIIYTWTPATHLSNPSIGNPTGYYPDTTTINYVVYIKSPNDCEGYDTINVWVVNQGSVFVPSAFTPNGDGLNDILIPIGIGYRQVDYFRILNRWGQQVYYSNKFKVGWDGTYQGRPAEMGVYFWELSLTDRFGKGHKLKGDVTLIR